jgi:hypothetical protein
MSADELPSWRKTSAKQAVVKFVAAVTDRNSPDFVPERDRVAVFDNDGTLWTEQPMYAQLVFALDRAAELGHPTNLEELHAGGMTALMKLLALTHAGITTGEFDAACRSWLASARHPRFGRPYPATVYQPMLELLGLLGRRGFSCWIFSGGGTDFMRTWTGDVYGLPPHRVIGSVAETEFRVSDDGPELLKSATVAALMVSMEKARPGERRITQGLRRCPGRHVAAANTAAKPLDNACPVRATLECRPSVGPATDGPGRCACSYGSDGPWPWGRSRGSCDVIAESAVGCAWRASMVHGGRKKPGVSPCGVPVRCRSA